MDYEVLWQDCLAEFAKKLPAQQFNTWIKPLTVQINAMGIQLLVPNRFHLEWVKERYFSQLHELLNTRFGATIPFSITLLAPLPEIKKAVGTHPSEPAENSPSERPIRNTPEASKSTKHQYSSPNDLGLSLNFSFDTFVTGKANQLARAVAIQVADNPGKAYNPLFLYGGVGLGKTHLIQAIGNHISKENTQAKIRYIHAERYVADVVRAYQYKGFDEFKNTYRSLDLLLIDDIQFFNGKSRTQEEFFYLFNTLIEAHKQVVITCDTFPKEIAGIDERLKSRFGWGLTVALEPPELEMRVAILLNKAELNKLNLNEAVAFFIAKHIRSNVRELEGALKRVIAYSQFHDLEITLNVAKEALRDLLAVQNRQISIENIQKTVADYYKIKVSDMHSKSRSRQFSRPRQIAMTLAKELTQLSLPEIGTNFGGRDHTTVLHAYKTIMALKETTPQIGHDFNLLLQVLRS